MKFYKLITIVGVMALGVMQINFANAQMNTCGPSSVTYGSSQTPTSASFLYANKQMFDLSAAGYKNTNHLNSGSGLVYKCDSDVCNDGAEVTMAAGHYFQGAVVDHKNVYECNIGMFGLSLIHI